MNRLYAAYHNHVEFFIVYIKEAHPSDGRVATANARAGISVKEPTSSFQRQQVANRACKELKLRWPCLVDDMENSASEAYAAWPTRLYIVGTDGRIAVAGGPGPRNLAPSMKEAEEWLKGFAAKTESTDKILTKPGAP